VAGNVPLAIRTFADGTYTDKPFTGPQTVQVPASSTVEVLFALDRSSMSGPSGSHYASILKITDSSKLTLSRLPVRAEPASAAGLWACLVTLDAVEPLSSNQSGTATGRDFVLKYLVHIDEAGLAKLLRNCFLGQLKTTGNPTGLALGESAVYAKGESEVDPRRFFSAMLPAGSPYVAGDTPYSKGGVITWTINHAADECIAHWYRQQLAGRPDLIAIRNFEVITKHDDPNRVLFQVKYLATNSAGEFDHLTGHSRLQAVHPRNTIADFHDTPDRGNLG
jgi:hypothetical protein